MIVLPKGRPIDGRIGADLDIVLDFDTSHLGNLHILLSFLHISESIAPHDHATVKDDPFSDDGSWVDGDIGIEDRVLANRGVFTDRDPGIEGDPIPDLATISDIDKGIDREVSAQLGRGADPGVGIDPFGLVRMRGKEAEDL